jgi:hypothetical protein
MKTTIFAKTGLLSCSLLLAASLFVACSDDEKYDVVGNPDNLVYFKANAENTITGTIVHTPVGHFGAVDAKFPVRILRPATQETRVTVTIDNSLINAYNEANGTNYVAMPESAIDASRLTVTIPKDSIAARDTIVVKVLESAFPNLNEKAYLLPIRISQVQGDGKGSEERGIGYVLVSTEDKLIKEIGSADDVLGSVLTDYAGWTAKYSTGAEINAGELFDGSLENGPQLRTDGNEGKNTCVIVDMQKQQNVSGFRLARYWKSYWGGWWIEEYYFSSVHIDLSNDGTTWTEAGTALEADMPKADGYQYISFYGPVPARYLRLTIESGESAVSSLAELGVFTN